MATNDIWSLEELKQAVRDSHPLLKDIAFFQDPNWTVHESRITPEAKNLNISFSIPDPHGSIGKKIVDSDIVMFYTHIYPNFWKEKVDVTPCPRCFVIGINHPACPIHCRLCASDKHDESSHNVNCEKCKNTGRPLQEIQSPGWICTHLRCRNCGKGHVSDAPDCEARNKTVRDSRLCKRGMIGQTLLPFNRINPTTPSTPFTPGPNSSYKNVKFNPRNKY